MKTCRFSFSHGREGALDELFQESGSDYTAPRVDTNFHGTDFTVNLSHKVDDKIDEFSFEHGISVEVGDEEGDIIALNRRSPENDELFSTLRQEPRKFVYQKLFHLV